MAKQIEIGTVIGRGWELYKGNMGLLILANLLLLVVSAFTCGVLAAPMIAGNYLIIQRLLKKDPVRPQVGDLFKGFEYFLNALLIMLVGIVASAIPVVNFVVSPIMAIGIMFVVFGKMGFSDALNKIFSEIKTGPFWMLVLAVFLGHLIGGLGIFLYYVGALFTLPLGVCIVVCAYHAAYEGVDAGQPPPVIPPEVPPLVDQTPPPPPPES